MIPWRDRLQQIGGRNAISRWSWIITIPLAVLVSSNYAASTTLDQVVLWQSIVLAVHVLLGLAMWVAWKTVLPATNRASRPVTALVFFGLLGLLAPSQIKPANASMAPASLQPVREHHLAVLNFKIRSMDWLVLSREGHQRARITPTGTWDWLTA